MLRIAFLLLAVAGGLALLLGLVAGIGLARVAIVSRAAPGQARSPATLPAAAPVNRASTAPSPPPEVSPAPAAAHSAVDAVRHREPGGSIVGRAVILPARAATLHGRGVRLADGPGAHLASWAGPQGWAEWAADVPAAGAYRVELLYACDAAAGGGAFVARVGDRLLPGEVGGTGGWDAYQVKLLGTVDLRPGRTRVTVRPTDVPAGRSLMNLREVRLVPAHGGGN